MPPVSQPASPGRQRPSRIAIARPQGLAPTTTAEALLESLMPAASAMGSDDVDMPRATSSSTTALVSVSAPGHANVIETLLTRVSALELLSQQHAMSIESLESENKSLKRSILLWELGKIKANSKPVSVRVDPSPQCYPAANLLTVARLEGFERQIASCIIPCTGNRRLAGKVGWNKLRKTCRDFRSAPVSLDLDPAVRIVPDNFPTIRRAIQNIDKSDAFDPAWVVVRPRPTPYVEQIVLDRRVILMADPDVAEIPVIHGRISMDEAAGGTIIRGLTIISNNPRDPWGSAIDVSGARDVLVECCELASSANDEAILNLHGRCVATVRKNDIRGGETHGVTGISIDGAANVTVVHNTIAENFVGVKLQASATTKISGNLISKNQRGVLLDEEDFGTIFDQGGFGCIMLKDNAYIDNRDGQDDASFINSLELLLHPLLRRFSVSSETGSHGGDEEKAVRRVSLPKIAYCCT